METYLTRYVIDYNCNGWVPYVWRNETPKPFLAGRVPQLQSDLQTSPSFLHQTLRN